MESVIRGVSIYIVLMLLFRIGGKRMMSQMTAFDLILLLIIGEGVSEALHGDDFSTTNAVVVVATLVLLERGFALLKRASPAVDRWLDDVPLIVVDNGRMLHERMKRADVTLEDILMAARAAHGLERIEQVKYAVLEHDGSISVIPAEAAS